MVVLEQVKGQSFSIRYVADVCVGVGYLRVVERIDCWRCYYYGRGCGRDQKRDQEQREDFAVKTVHWLQNLDWILYNIKLLSIGNKSENK